MRIVLDTNVFVSGVFFGGQPGRILAAWRDARVRLVLSPEILEEYVEVLHRLEKLYAPVKAEPVIELILAGSEIISAPPLKEPVSSDPDDDKFIACDLASKARVIVSGDNHLLSMERYRNIDILSPSRFVKKYL